MFTLNGTSKWNLEKLHYVIKISLIFHLSLNKYNYVQHKDFAVCLLLEVVVGASFSN